jgi:ubiquinone biosynthesis protein COQ4
VELIASMLSEGLRRPIDMASLTRTSPYLKHEKLCEWMGFMVLHRIGDLEMSQPVDYATIHMKMMRELIDRDRINILFAEARRKDPELDAWFAKRELTNITPERLAECPPGSLGELFHRHVVAMGYDLDLGFNLPLNDDFDYWSIRALQIHDLEHLLGGGGFNVIGEMIPASTRWGNLFRHFEPELAGLLSVPTWLLFLGIQSSAMLYTPEVYPTLLGRFQRGWLIGQTSGPYFRARIEDVFHLPMAEARQALDINNVDDADTTAMSEVMLDDRNAA